MPRSTKPALGRALAKRRNLVELTAAFFVDAEDFFSKFYLKNGVIDFQEATPKAPYYPHLEYLALTSDKLHPRRIYWPQSRTMLQGAAIAAFRHIPKLKVIEIWTAGPGYGCVFQYKRTWERVQTQHNITGTSTWDMDLATEFQVWSDMARHVAPGQNLSVRTRPISGANFKSYVDFLIWLNLGERIIDTASEYHVACETWSHSPELPPYFY